jgi:hypothetical protein
VFPWQPLQRPSYFLVEGVVAEVAPRVQPQASVFGVRVVEPLQECLPVDDQAPSGFLFELRARSPIEHEDVAPGHEEELGALPRQRAADLDTHPEIACSQKAPVRAWGCPLTTWSGLSGSSSGPAMYWTITREPTIRSARVLSSGFLYSSRRVVTVDHLAMRIAYYYRRFSIPTAPRQSVCPYCRASYDDGATSDNAPSPTLGE